jgi:hypothetical protein
MARQTRREFLRVLGAAAGSLMIPQALLGRQRPARKPNVVLIFTDDQGSIDLNCYGAKDLYTDNLDRRPEKARGSRNSTWGRRCAHRRVRL